MWDRRGSDERKRARALYHIDSILQLHGLSLKTFGLPTIDQIALHEDPEPLDVSLKYKKMKSVQDDLSTEVVDEDEARFECARLVEMMNDEQRAAFATLVEAAFRGQSAPNNCFFLEVFLEFIDSQPQ